MHSTGLASKGFIEVSFILNDANTGQCICSIQQLTMFFVTIKLGAAKFKEDQF